MSISGTRLLQGGGQTGSREAKEAKEGKEQERRGWPAGQTGPGSLLGVGGEGEKEEPKITWRFVFV